MINRNTYTHDVLLRARAQWTPFHVWFFLLDTTLIEGLAQEVPPPTKFNTRQPQSSLA